MNQDLKVAVVQYQITKDAKDSERKIEELVGTASFKNVDIVGLPEECLGSEENVKQGYDPFQFLQSVAKKYSIFLFGAVYCLDEHNNISNSGFLYNPKGERILLQKKIVLTPPAIEAGFVAGDTIKVLDTEFGRIAILVCKDSFHRYSAWFFNELMKEKVDIVLIPSSSITVSQRSINLWADTLKTMSMLYNVFILAPGTVGLNGIDGVQSFGNSIIISPLKVVLAQGSQERKEILYATLEKEDLDILRDPEAEKWQPSEVPKIKTLKL